jgi:thiamine-phosphate pyrophosphorylase
MTGSRNNLAMTPGAARTIARCRRQAGSLARTDSWSAFLVLALLQDESLASACLQRLGITRDWLSSGLLGAEVALLAAQSKNENSGNIENGRVDNGSVVSNDENSNDENSNDENSNDENTEGLNVALLDSETMLLESSVCSTTGAVSRIHEALNDPLEFTRVLDRATELARRGSNDSGISSANLLVAILETNGAIRQQFETAGATLAKIREELYPEQVTQKVPIAVEFNLIFVDGAGEENLMTDEPAASPVVSASDEQSRVPVRTTMADDMWLKDRNESAPVSVWRILDANLNRAREGLRVLEDFARFLADSHDVSLKLKSMRHDLVAAEKQLFADAGIGLAERLQFRDTQGDVGTSQMTDGEQQRSALADVIIANARRVEESLRSLEEFGKLVSAPFSAAMKSLRYHAYTAEKSLASLSPGRLLPGNHPAAVSNARFSNAENLRGSRLLQAQVYVLITESMCRLPWQQVVEQCLQAGVDVLQLREKSMNDRELLRRAEWIRAACENAQALFIVNDRPDIAAICAADGVHVGQEEFSVAEARRILKPGQLVGLSTHSLEQALQATTAGADYLGVGPVFPSQTKSFEQFPGLDFVNAVANSAVVTKPWFAIGGIHTERLPDLIRAGANRVAVTSVVAGAESPGDVIREIRSLLAASTFQQSCRPGACE